MTLKTNYSDDIYNGLRKYKIIENSDGTVSFNDVTEYIQQGDIFNAAEINATNTEINATNTRIDTTNTDIDATNTRIDTANGKIDDTNTRIDTTNTRIDSLNAKVDNLTRLDRVYPVGSIYLSANKTSPATLFGGTWAQIKDRFLFAAGTYSAGGTGGEATHTLTVNEMPSHKHAFNQLGWATAGTPALSSSGQWVVYDVNNTSTIKTGMYETGGGKAHNNMPPYLVVYMWKRTA